MKVKLKLFKYLFSTWHFPVEVDRALTVLKALKVLKRALF